MTLFCPPNEFEFLDRGFKLSPDHDPDEGVASFVRSYEDGVDLIVALQVGSTSSLFVSITKQTKVLSEITLECVEKISFQAWLGERTIRGSFSLHAATMDLRVHYDPVPSIHVSVLSKNG